MRARTRSGILAVALTGLFVLGCSEYATGPAPVVPVRIRVDVAEARLESLGDTARLVAVVVDGDGAALPGFAVRWRLERAGVVDTTARPGVLRAIRNGQVRVWAELVASTGTVSPDGGYRIDTASVPVDIVVAQRPASVSLPTAEQALWSRGTRLPLAPIVRDARGNAIVESAPTVTWSSSDAAVATVDAAGVVQAVGDGSARIRATVGGLSADVGVRVSSAIAVSVCGSVDGVATAPCGALQLSVRERTP